MSYPIESCVSFLTLTFAEFIFNLSDPYIIYPDCASKGVFYKAIKGSATDPIFNCVVRLDLPLRFSVVYFRY
jgi:hypothetical protein